MRELSPAVGAMATNGYGKFAVQESAGVKSDANWFSDMAQSVHPEKPGTILHLTTGVDERLCQKYAAGSVRPSSSFLRALLRSENGWTYLAFVMAGSDAQWWREIQIDSRIGQFARRQLT